MSERLLKPEEAARRLSVSSKSVRRWLRAGKLNGIRVGRRWRIRQADLDEFLVRSFSDRSPGGRPDVVVAEVAASDSSGGFGKLVIPAGVSQRLGIAHGELLVLAVREGGALHATRVSDQVEKLKGSLAGVSPARSLVDELIADRRREEADG